MDNALLLRETHRPSPNKPGRGQRVLMVAELSVELMKARFAIQGRASPETS